MNITPSNGEDGYGFNYWTDEDFKKDYEYRPIKVVGVYDHSKEIFVERPRDHARGYCVVTPFYTHLNSKGEKVGIFVERGWIDDQYRHSKIHYDADTNNEIVEILGIIRDTEAGSKNQIKNDIKENRIMSIDIREFEDFRGIKMPELERNKWWYVRETDFGQKNKGNLYPQLPSKESFLNWYITPQTHQAYSNFWLFLTCTILASNILLYVAL